MASLIETTARQFTAATTEPITGVPLDVSEDHLLRSKGLTPILSCWCVCLTEPCDCKDGPIVWIPDAVVQQRVATDRRNKDGEQLFEYTIDRNAPIVAESFMRTTVSQLARLHKGFTKGAAVIRKAAPGSYHEGQTCIAGTMYEVYSEQDGLATTFYYVAVGSC